MLTDILALGLAWFATTRAERPADASKTYGYHRTGILAAFANAATLIVMVLARRKRRIAGPLNSTALRGRMRSPAVGCAWRGWGSPIRASSAMRASPRP